MPILRRPKRVPGEHTDRPGGDDLRVMFDPQIFCHQRFGGVSRYVCNMALEMQRMAEVTPLIVAPFHFNEYLDQLPKSLVRGRRVRWLEGLTAVAYGASVLPGKIAARRFLAGCLAQYLLFSCHSPPRSPQHPNCPRYDPREVSQVLRCEPFHYTHKGRQRHGSGSRDLHL